MLHAEGLRGLIIFLVVAGIVMPLFHRARIGTVLGFLIAGTVLGPYGLGRFTGSHPWLSYVTFDNPHRAEVLAEFGIVMLLFLLGLELSLTRLWQLRRYVLGVGLAQVVLSSVVIGATVRFAVAPPPAGIVLGLCLALSSTAIVMQLLTEQHRTASPVGRIALSVLLFQDMMVVPILFVVGVLTRAGRGEVPTSLLDLAEPFTQALAAVVVIMLAGRYLVGPLLRSAVRTGSRDLIMAITLLILVLSAVATGLAGLSVALGAFLAGLLLSGSEAHHHIEVDLEPFKGLLLGIFFITVGTSVDLGVVAMDAGWIALAVIGLMAVKAVVVFAAARAFGVPRANAVEVALLLSQAGEFAFVVIGLAQSGTLLPPRIAADTVAVVGLSMMLTPLAALAGRTLARRVEAGDTERTAPWPREALELADHVVIGGFGRVGQTIARILQAENVPYIAIDANGDQVAAMRREGHAVFFGDAGRPELLQRVGASRARAFVVTLNSPQGAERMVAAARTVQPKAPVFARASDPHHAAILTRIGAVEVIPETVEASLQLGGRIMEGLGVPAEAVQSRLAQMREEITGRLTAPAHRPH